MAHDKKTRAAQAQALKCLREDIRGMDFVKLADDGHTMLISKPRVLEYINDWIEECLDPAHAAA